MKADDLREKFEAIRTKGHADAAKLAMFPDLVDALGMIQPLAESYLKAAPDHPDNAKLETARCLLAEARKLQ